MTLIGIIAASRPVRAAPGRGATRRSFRPLTIGLSLLAVTACVNPAPAVMGFPAAIGVDLGPSTRVRPVKSIDVSRLTHAIDQASDRQRLSEAQQVRADHDDTDKNPFPRQHLLVPAEINAGAGQRTLER